MTLWLGSLRRLRRDAKRLVFLVAIVALGTGPGIAVMEVARVSNEDALPFGAPSELVRITEHSARGSDPAGRVSPRSFRYWQREAESLAGVSAFVVRKDGLATEIGDRQVLLRAALVSSEFFDVLRIRLLLGRPPSPMHREAVLSHRAWLEWLGGRTDLGRTALRIEGRAMFDVVGVMPPGMTFPDDSDIWVVLGIPTEPNDAQAGVRSFGVVGRMKPGTTLDHVRSDLEHVQRNLSLHFPGSHRDWRVAVEPIARDVFRAHSDAIRVLLASVVLLALAAWIDVLAHVFLSARRRAREAALCAALGGPRWQVAAGFVLEAATIATLGSALAALGAAGLLNAVATQLAAVGALTPPFSRWHIAASAAFAAGAGTLVAGVIPGVWLWHREARTLFLSPARINERTWAMRGWTACVATLQVAVATALAVQAFALIDTAARMARAREHQPAGLAFARVQVPDHGPDPAMPRLARLIDGWRSAVAASARTAPVAGSSCLPGWPVSASVITLVTHEAGLRPESGPGVPALPCSVTEDFFTTWQIPLLRGRAFNARDVLDHHQMEDGAPPNGRGVVILSSSVARRLYGGGNPIGRVVALSDAWVLDRVVVGVVGDAESRVDETGSLPLIYVPYAQGATQELILALRSTSAGDAARDLDAATRTFPAGTTTSPASTLEVVAEAVERPFRGYAVLTTMLGALGLLLSATALFGSLALAIEIRTREFAIRQAVGATPGRVVAALTSWALALVGGGVAMGVLVARLADAALRSRLTTLVKPTTGHVVVGVIVVLVVTALATGAVLPRLARLSIVDVLREN